MPSLLVSSVASAAEALAISAADSFPSLSVSRAFRSGGTPRKNVGDDEDWPRPPAASDEAWQASVARLEERHRALASTVQAMRDEQFDEKVVGEEYTIREMIHGVVEHGLYHGGQLALLKKLVERT